MFTGIITGQGLVEHFEERGDGMEMRLKIDFTDLGIGESIAVNGACLTAERAASDGRAQFWLSRETLIKCAQGRWGEGRKVNLERALRADGRFSGHFVQGHVDGTGRLLAVAPDGESRIARFFVPQELRPFIVEKGSIALDGVSLTVNGIGGRGVFNGREGFAICVTIIPHTWTHTAFASLKVGDEINVETDMLAKHVARLVGFDLAARGAARPIAQISNIADYRS